MTADLAPVLTIDGPSGSGKGTISRRVAKALGWGFLDSGALYRAVGLAALQQGLTAEHHEALANLARDLQLGFSVRDDGRERISLDGLDVTDALRTERCADMASQVAALPIVRSALLDRQRAFRRAPGLVADGRDMGTVVFPDAKTKVFLTASAEARAQRRRKQLMAQGLDVNLDGLLREIRARDARDQDRPVAPLRPAADAVILDSTDVSIDAVVDRVLALLA